MKERKNEDQENSMDAEKVVMVSLIAFFKEWIPC